MNTNGATSTELNVLERIHREGPGVSHRLHQRYLASRVGLSLGMTNVIVKRLAQKGWLSVRKVNNRNIQYIVTPRGIAQITRRSVRYLKRTLRNIVDYRDILDRYLEGLKERGCRSVAVVGHSDLEFIVEFLCQRRGLAYARVDDESEQPASWHLYGEDERLPAARRTPTPTGGRASLREILAQVPGRFTFPAGGRRDGPANGEGRR